MANTDIKTWYQETSNAFLVDAAKCSKTSGNILVNFVRCPSFK